MATGTDKIKGKGTKFYRLTTGVELPAAWDVTLFTRIADVKEITPNSMSKDTSEDAYLDDAFGFKEKTSGSKDPGTVAVTLAWKPADAAQQTLYADFRDDVKTYYALVYTNGTVDYVFGEITTWGKPALAESDTITRNIEITLSGAPVIPEDV